MKKNIVNIINEEIKSFVDENGYGDLSKSRLYTIRKEVKKINPNFDVQIDGSKSWKTYWLVDKSKQTNHDNYVSNELIISYKDEYHNPIGAYSDYDFNRMIEYFKKMGKQYMENGGEL
jgi:hypothetical protein